MSDMAMEEFRTALRRHASEREEVFPSALRLIEAESHPVGRLWDVARVVMSDQEQLRYLAGGNRPDEVAAMVACWADSRLSLEEIRMVVDAGGYDPDPFEPLALAGCLRQVLRDNGATRVIQGERAGSWISDQMALTAEGDVVPRVLEMIGAAPSATL